MNYHRNYSVLGNNCVPQTIAIPSNTKFLSPCNPVYDKKYTTNTIDYPGHEEDKTLNEPNKTNIIDKLKNKAREKSCTNC